MQCPSDDVLAALLAEELGPDQAAAIHRHADTCDECRELIAAIAAQQTRSTASLAQARTELAETSGPQPSGLDEPAALAGRFGRYTLLGRLGTGGMGIVYAAFDPQLDRRVALKVLNSETAPGSTDDGQRTRLLREAQALARLSHPNVVSVHDAGIQEGHVFMTMELVEGTTLRSWLHERRTWQQVRDVYVQAGRGLAGAHAAGLVHRDFKPDNVLIGRDGRVRVADFGLARPARADPADREDSQPSSSDSLLDTPLTRAGSIIGTLRYMAPEQLRAQELDARTDQFAFGLSLYESLYGAAAFTAKKSKERLAEIEAGRIQPPPAGHHVPDWLGRAARRAMAAEPGRRFPDMEAMLTAMAHDARQRRGLGIAAALALASSLAAAAAVRALSPDQRCKGAERRLAGVWDYDRKVLVRRAFGASHAPDADAQLDRTTTALDAYAHRWVDTAREVCTASRIRAEQPERVMEMQTSCLSLRLSELKSLVDVLAAPDAALVGRAPEAVSGLSSVRSCEDVVALLDVVPLPEDPAARRDISRIREALAAASALRLAGRYSEALKASSTAVESAAPLRYRPLEAEAFYVRGFVEHLMGEAAQSEADLLSAFAAAETGRADTVKVSAANQLEKSAALAQQFRDAHRWALLARATLERIGPNPELEGEFLANTGDLALIEDDPRTAVTNYEKALQLFVSVLGPDHIRSLDALTNLAGAYASLHRPKEAASVAQSAISTIVRVRGPDHPTLIAPLLSLAMADVETRRFTDAHDAVDRAIRVARARFGPQHLKVAECLDYSATVYQEERRFQDALGQYREALQMKRRFLPANDPDLVASYDGAGQSLLELGKPSEAVPLLEAALAIGEPSAENRAGTRYALARALASLGRDPHRAATLAAQARDDYLGAHLTGKAELVESWLRHKP